MRCGSCRRTGCESRASWWGCSGGIERPPKHVDRAAHPDSRVLGDQKSEAQPAICLTAPHRLVDIHNDDVYLMNGAAVQVSKWGNSLAIRLPASVVEALNLKEGDEIEIHVAGE